MSSHIHIRSVRPAAIVGVRGNGLARLLWGRTKFIYMKCRAMAAAWFSTFFEKP
jgi:hypothetical protein